MRKYVLTALIVPVVLLAAMLVASGFAKPKPRYELFPIEGALSITKYHEYLVNRTINLEIAAKTLDGTVVMPGAVFSFNDIIGLATEEKGYRRAKIFIDGREEEGLGGGICQLSSALYNAALAGGLEIVERHPHSRDVDYVPEGRDAATAYGGVDFRFRNSTVHPIFITALMRKGELIVALDYIFAVYD